MRRRLVQHAASPGFRLTFCGRRRGATVVYAASVTCRQCLGGFRRRAEKAYVLCAACGGEGQIGDNGCATCYGTGHESKERIEAAGGLAVEADAAGGVA